MSKVKFNIGNHASFTGRGAEGELNFLTYPGMQHLGLCIKKDGMQYGLGTMRLIPFQRNDPDEESGSITLLQEEDNFETILNEFNYKIFPLFMEMTGETNYNLYYYTGFDLSGMRFYCSNNDIEIVTDDSHSGQYAYSFMWRRAHSTTWIDF